MYTQEQMKQNYGLMIGELRKLVAEVINAVPDELRICNRIKPQGIYLKDGKIVKIGKMKDIKGDSSLEQVFLELGENK